MGALKSNLPTKWAVEKISLETPVVEESGK